VTAQDKLNSAANAAFSTGPTTPEGKARSARNAYKRQLLANSVAFPTECNEEFLELLNDYREALSPVGFLEERVVETITVCDWYRRRYWVLGMARVGHATALQEQSADDFTNEMHNDIAAVQTALAVSNLADTGRTLEYFRRCDSGYSREHRHARQELKELQTDRAKREHLERLSRPPDFDIESCFVHTDDLAEEAKKYSQRTEPDQKTSSTDVQSWEPYSPNDDAIAEPLVEGAVEGNAQRDVQVDTQPVVASHVHEPASVADPEKNRRTE
jgi:hypothetical protein